ncbi:hypothetical protein [Agrobacterium sp. CG674]
MVLRIGQRVRWTAAQTWREGIITAIVPAGIVPDGPAGSTKPRDHVSYVVTAQKLNSRAQRHGGASEYWPKIELLRCV